MDHPEDWIVKSIDAIGECLAGASIGAVGGSVPLFTNNEAVALSRAAVLAKHYAELPGALGYVDPGNVKLDTLDDPAQYRVMFYNSRTSGPRLYRFQKK